MGKKLPLAITVVAATVGFLIYTAASSTARSVVTVDELLAGGERARVQVGARVIPDSKISFTSEPERTVHFTVMDIAKKNEHLEVVYHGSMPDTLKPGRDVILQGDYTGDHFAAKSLQTQCPSKYEPPTPE